MPIVGAVTFLIIMSVIMLFWGDDDDKAEARDALKFLMIGACVLVGLVVLGLVIIFSILDV